MKKERPLEKSIFGEASDREKRKQIEAVYYARNEDGSWKYTIAECAAFFTVSIGTFQRWRKERGIVARVAKNKM